MAEKPRLKLPKEAKKGEVIEIKTLLPHIMESGQRKDKDGKAIPRKIINKFACEFNGKPVFSGQSRAGDRSQSLHAVPCQSGRERHVQIHLDRRRRHGHHGGRKHHRELTARSVQSARHGITRIRSGGSDDAWRDSGERHGRRLARGWRFRHRRRIGRQRASNKKEAPLETKGDASARPWKRYAGWPARDESKYNTLGNWRHRRRRRQPRKLAGPITGDAAKGAELVADRNRGGSCLACHVMGPAGNADLPGNVAPDLSEIGSAGREDEWLFNYIYDARVYNPETVMPPWGSHGLFNDQEINDMVAFLKTLKSPAVFKTALDDPEQTAGAGRETRKSRSDRKSRHVGGRQGAGALEADGRGRQVVPELPQRCRRRRSRPGRRRCRSGSRGSTRCWAWRSSSLATPRPPPAPTG